MLGCNASKSGQKFKLVIMVKVRILLVLFELLEKKSCVGLAMVQHSFVVEGRVGPEVPFWDLGDLEIPAKRMVAKWPILYKAMTASSRASQATGYDQGGMS